MISNQLILKTLRDLDKKYQQATDILNPLYFSKVAMLELCGWIEMAMDDIVMNYSSKILQNKNNIAYVEKTIVKQTHGFDYYNHFRQMVMKVIGIRELENIEKRMPLKTRDRLAKILSILYNKRNELAHSYIQGMTIQIDAPSVSISNCVIISKDLKYIERQLSKII